MIQVSPDDLPKHWEFVEAGLNQIIRRTKEKWTPTHVLHALNEGRASLFVCDEGFCVLQRLADIWTAEPYLFIWCMWFKPGVAKQRRSALQDWLEDVATRTCGNPRAMEFSSPRMGWKAMEPEWEIKRIIWRRRKANG